MNPITILFLSAFLLFATETHAELRNNQSADVVVGQPNFTSRTANQTGGANVNVTTLYDSYLLCSDGKRLFIADKNNHRVLIYNSIPTANNAAADVVIGQPNFTSRTANQTGGANVKANTLFSPGCVFSDGKRLFITDYYNNRVLIYNSIPTANNASADVVVGQPDFTSKTENQTGIADVKANTLYNPTGVFSDGKRLFIAERTNHRVLIYNSIPTANNASADVVIGQPNFTSRTENQTGAANVKANTLYQPWSVFSDGKKLFIADDQNHRVLIYNSIPTANNASADVVIGQADFTSRTENQTGAANVKANTLARPLNVFSDGKRLFIADYNNHRVLIYNSIPTTNNVSADSVIGQPNFTSNAINQGGNVGANTLYFPISVFSDGRHVFITDNTNNRILIYNIASGSPVKPGPQFDQGKAVLGKVFNDINSNGSQDDGEKGVEGVKVASDTGIYAITDEDGKYHFPYIETGQHLLKIDESTLPEGATITTDSPYKVTVTKGVLTKVSFGIKLPPESNKPNSPMTQQLNNEPLLKVSISQDPVLLKPRLSIQATQDKDDIVFNIGCNYFLFVEKSVLTIYDGSYKKVRSIDLPKPLPSRFTLPLSGLPNPSTGSGLGPESIEGPNTYYYQLSVYDKNGRQNRTGIGTFRIKL